MFLSFLSTPNRKKCDENRKICDEYTGDLPSGTGIGKLDLKYSPEEPAGSVMLKAGESSVTLEAVQVAEAFDATEIRIWTDTEGITFLEAEIENVTGS